MDTIFSSLLIGFCLSLASSQKCAYNILSGQPRAHCSEICVPFSLGVSTASGSCFALQVFGSPNHNTYVYVLFFKQETCPSELLYDRAAFQAIDQDGYPVGRWEVGYRTNILQDHCILEGGRRSSLYLDETINIPSIRQINCTETASLLARIRNPARDFPSYVLIDQTKIEHPKFIPTVMLWHYQDVRSVNVTFIAEILANKPGDPFLIYKATIIRNTILQYIPKPQPPPVARNECFTISGDYPILSSSFQLKFLGYVSRLGGFPVPSEQYLKEVAETLLPRTTTSKTMTTRGKGLRPIVPGSVPPPIISDSRKDQAKEEQRIQEIISQEKDIYERCELTKKCLTSQVNLKKDGTRKPKPGRAGLDPCIIAKECDVMISYGSADIDFEVPEDHVYIEFVGRSNYWVAIGLSSDQRMGKDFVFECVREGSEDIQMYTSWNVIQGVNKRLNRSDSRYANNVKVYQTGFSEGNTFCKFSAKKVISVFEDGGYTFNLERTLYFLLMAVGQSDKGIATEKGNLNDHTDDYRYTSGYPVAIGVRFSPTKFQQALIYLHGQFMYVAFLFCFSVSTFLARYYKETLIRKTLLGMPKWLFWHVILHLVGFFLVILGHFCLTFANERWTRLGSNETSFHLWTSLIAGAFYFFNVLMGLLNHGRGAGAGGTSSSQGWQIIHALTGHITYLVSSCISRSDRVLYSYLPCGISTIVSVWVWIYFLFNIVMSYHYCWIDYVRGEELGLYALGLRELLVQPSKGVVAPGKKVRMIILYAYVGSALVITLACMMVALFSSKENACRPETYFIDLVS